MSTPNSLTPLPMSLLTELSCHVCERPLSCSPVHAINTNIGWACGRCAPRTASGYRLRAYEILAALYAFPCARWKSHCEKWLPWNEVKKHERNCGGAFWNSCRGEKKVPRNEEITKIQVPDELIDQLQCIICQSYLSCDPVYVTIDDNEICHRCIHNNGIPNLCLREVPYEKLAAIMIFPCVYKNRGCQVRMPFGRDLWKHESECTHGLINQKFKPKNKNPSEKERGVIMTHSGHIYATITPNSALWGPDQQKGTSDVIKKEYIDEVLKRGLKDELTNINNTNSKNSVPENRSSNIDKVDSFRKPTRGKIDQFLSNSAQQRLDESTIFNRQYSSNGSKEPIFLISDMKNDGYPGYIKQLSYDPSEFDVPRRSSNNFRQSTQSVDNSIVSGYAEQARASGSGGLRDNEFVFPVKPLNYSSSFTEQSRLSGQVQPKRGDSFKIGNQLIIDELKGRQKKRSQQKESDRESIISSASEAVVIGVEGNMNYNAHPRTMY